MENERFGLIAAIMRNAFRGKGDKIVQPSDFFTSAKQEPKKSTPQAIYDKMRMWCSALGG
jgi:hypothetical protein